MTKGGHKRKTDSWSFVHTNNDLLRMYKTIALETFVHIKQRKYVAHIVRKDNRSIVKRLMFNNNRSVKPGPQPILLSSVMKNERCKPEEMFQISIEQRI